MRRKYKEPAPVEFGVYIPNSAKLLSENYERYIDNAENSNNSVLSKVSNNLLPAVTSLEAFLSKHKNEDDKYQSIMKVLSEIKGKALDMVKQATLTDRYIYNSRAYINEQVDAHLYKHDYALTEEVDKVITKKLHGHFYLRQNLNNAKQSNYRVIGMLTDDAKFCNPDYAHSLNRNVEVLNDLMESLFDETNDGLNICNRSLKLLLKVTRSSLSITTDTNYTGRSLNGLLNHCASVYTKQEREPKSWEIEQKA